jgi:Arm DNA-binding domain
VPTIKLTQSAAEKIKPPISGRVEYWDSRLPGFGLRISESGRKTWVAMYRVGGKLVRKTIGTAALIDNVADSRERPRQSMLKAQSGVSPVAEKRRRERAAKVEGGVGARRKPRPACSAQRHLALGGPLNLNGRSPARGVDNAATEPISKPRRVGRREPGKRRRCRGRRRVSLFLDPPMCYAVLR